MEAKNAKEFKKALDSIVAEKNIDPEVVYSAMELALTSAYKKNFNSKTNVKVVFDRNTGDIKVYSFLTVVEDDKKTKEEYEDELFEKYAEDEDLDTEVIENEEVEGEEEAEEEKETISFFNPETEIKLSDAKKIDKTLEIGDTIDTEVTPKDFGRVATSTAKQVVIQKIREAERNSIMDEFGDKQDELVVGTLSREDSKTYYVDLGKTFGLLPKDEIIPGEKLEMGSQVKCYVSKLEIGTKGVFILLSRSHYGFLKRLLELEIPELSDGTVMLYSVARDAGSRSKIAVYTEVDNVEPVGSIIGSGGSRINRVLRQIGNEKVDVVLYDKDPIKFIQNALSPARDVEVFVKDYKKREAIAVVNKDNLSLAIGKKGQNVKLASRLTHYKIEVKNLDEVDIDEYRKLYANTVDVVYDDSVEEKEDMTNEESANA